MRTYVSNDWRYDATASRRKNGEGSWGTKTINGIKYKFYKDVNGNYFYGKTNAEINAKKDAYYEKYKDAKKSLKKQTIVDKSKEVKSQTFGGGILKWLKKEKFSEEKDLLMMDTKIVLWGKV